MLKPDMLTTGLPGLDRALKGVIAGDNIVWRVDDMQEYLTFVQPFCAAARRNGRTLVYFRFASHPPLLPDDAGAEVVELRPEEGFEAFIAAVHAAIERAGRGAFYVFDCLSDLLVDWYSDQMLGNFFMLTCPYLYDLETVTYFALLRNYHSSHAVDPILQTTQLFIDVYRSHDKLYIRPLKTQYRYSATIDMLHVWEGNDFLPVSASSVIADIQAHAWAGMDADLIHGSWERTFIRGRELCALARGDALPDDARAVYDRLARMVVSRDTAMLRLVARYLTLQDILEIRQRIIGTGLIGGKTTGMLVARAIIRAQSPRLSALLEPHDSFYVGSDVFYTYLVRNGIWWLRQQQRDPETFLNGAGLARQRILAGAFPDYIVKQFAEMLDYFGPSPIIVRSSSLLEDNFGNAFAGKYPSVFCANQGPRERRLEDFLAAVRTVYAGTMSEEALRYRARRGLLDSDEQMALLVMRVSGARYGSNFYPQMAGVGFSYNPYVWSEAIDPRAGVIRLVFGLGTRAVDRSDDDYTRVVALNAPTRRPEANYDEVRQYSQQRVDYLDLDANQVVSGLIDDVVLHSPGVPIDMFADRIPASLSSAVRHNVLTFNRLLAETPFVGDMRELLAGLEGAYGTPVDIEFTANFFAEDTYSINLVQCRPLPGTGAEMTRLPKLKVKAKDAIIRARGAVIGQSRLVTVSRVIYVVPAAYSALPDRDRYTIARVIGLVNRATDTDDARALMLLGPGRWGTSTPSLGVPVSFADINRVSVLCEIVTMHDHLIPDASLGTHFLNELVEMDILYLALFPGQGDNRLDGAFFEHAPNRLAEIAPQAAAWAHVVRVLDAADLGGPLTLAADAVEQRVICYRG